MEQNIDFEIEVCRICKCALIHNVVNIGQKGLNKLINVSAICKDGLFSENDYTTSNLRLHAQCRKNYTKDSNLARAVKKQEVNNTSVFLETSDTPMQDLHLIDYEDQCLFCAEDASELFILNQKRKSKKRNVTKVSKAETRESILKATFVHDDQWSHKVRERIQGVDLVALNARYHQICFAKFFNKRRATGNKRGRPECTQISEQMEQIYKLVESYGSPFSIQDIIEAFPIELPMDKITIRRKLIERYGDKLVVMDSKGKPSIYCFASTSLKIVYDQYMERLERQSNPETLDLSVSGLTDRVSVVRAAANIISEDIKSRTYETKFYPASTHFWQDIKSVVPNTLDIFLKVIITDNTKDANDYDRKITALAHTIVSAARPRSFRSPLLLGISSMIHQKYPSKTLIDLLSSLGFCESHSEVNKSGNSTISQPPCQKQTEADCESYKENTKFENSTSSHPPSQEQTEADCESYKFENSTRSHPPSQQQTEADCESYKENTKFGNSPRSHAPSQQQTEADCESYKENTKFGNSPRSHPPSQQQTEADCESYKENNKFGNSTISHSPCQQQTEAEDSTQYVSDNADVNPMMQEVPKEMLELISCKCKKSSRRTCSDDKCCNKFNNTLPYEEVEVFVKEEKIENGMDPLESLEKACTENYVKAINKYEYDDGSDEDMENVCTVNLSKKRRIQ